MVTGLMRMLRMSRRLDPLPNVSTEHVVRHN